MNIQHPTSNFQRPTSNEKPKIQYRTLNRCFHFFIFSPSTFDFHSPLNNPFYQSSVCWASFYLIQGSMLDVRCSMFFFWLIEDGFRSAPVLVYTSRIYQDSQLKRHPSPTRPLNPSYDLFSLGNIGSVSTTRSSGL